MVISDTLTVKALLQEIAKDKEWSETEVNNDLAILERNRLFHVQDLKALSKESWAVIELLPIVKDLLRSAIDPNWSSWYDESRTDQKRKQSQHTIDENKKNGNNSNGKKKTNNNSNSNSNNNSNNNEKKKNNAEKKNKKEKKKGKEIKEFVSPSLLGAPVVPAILTKPSDLLFLHPTSRQEDYVMDSENQFSGEILSDDHLTIQNTIRNGASFSNDTGEEELMSPSTPSGRRKSVTFSEETPIIIENSKKKNSNGGSGGEKKNKKNNKKKMASMNKVVNGFNHFTNHPVVKFKKMKKKQCRKLPPVPANDPFLQGLYEKLTIASNINNNINNNE